MNIKTERDIIQKFLLVGVATIMGLSHLLFSYSIEEQRIYSKAMEKELPIIIILPDSYPRSEEAYPVVYLLHGFGGNYRNWTELTTVEELSDVYNLIIVCPDGGVDSWYFDSPMDPTSQYETHIATEVVAFIDGNYRTLATREKRAITGLSMGGHGALFLAIRHPQIFGAAGSMSGGVDIRDSSKKWHLRQKIGSIKEFPQRWDSLTVITNIEKFQDAHLALIIDCGIKDMFLQMNREFHEKLLQAEIPHDYIERPGDHNWKYWNNAVKYQLLFFYEFFQEIPED